MALLFLYGFLWFGDRYHKVTLLTSDQMRIVASYYPPKGERAPGVILLPMLGRDRHSWDALARRLQQEGYGCLSLDLRGHGESWSLKKGGDSWLEFGQEDYSKMRLDVEAGWRFMTRQSKIIRDRIAIIGADIGANLALIFAAQHLSIKTLVLLSPGLNYRGLRTREAMQSYGERPVLIITGGEDIYAAESSRELFRLARGKKTLKLYAGPVHGTKLLRRYPGLFRLIVEWLEATL